VYPSTGFVILDQGAIFLTESLGNLASLSPASLAVFSL